MNVLVDSCKKAIVDGNNGYALDAFCHPQMTPENRGVIYVFAAVNNKVDIFTQLVIVIVKGTLVPFRFIEMALLLAPCTANDLAQPNSILKQALVVVGQDRRAETITKLTEKFIREENLEGLTLLVNSGLMQQSDLCLAITGICEASYPPLSAARGKDPLHLQLALEILRILINGGANQATLRHVLNHHQYVHQTKIYQLLYGALDDIC